jgi:hypothetical protein
VRIPLDCEHARPAAAPAKIAPRAPVEASAAASNAVVRKSA